MLKKQLLLINEQFYPDNTVEVFSPKFVAIKHFYGYRKMLLMLSSMVEDDISSSVKVELVPVVPAVIPSMIWRTRAQVGILQEYSLKIKNIDRPVL